MNRNNTLSLSVMSGKGGVGKTNIILNLGYALHLENMTAMLMDCDLGLANLDVLLGISPERNLHDLLQNGVDAEDVLVCIEKGFDMLPATSGIPELVEMDEDLQDILFKKLISLAGEYDYLMLDLGAGISNTVLSFATLTQLRIVIVTPEPTSLTDSYAMIKVLVTRTSWSSSIRRPLPARRSRPLTDWPPPAGTSSTSNCETLASFTRTGPWSSRSDVRPRS